MDAVSNLEPSPPEDDPPDGTHGDADPQDFPAVEAAMNDAAKRVNATWITFVLFCVYFFITTLSVTHAMLFRETPIELPIFKTPLPLQTYFIVAPIFVLVFHVYLIALTIALAEKVAIYFSKVNSHFSALSRTFPIYGTGRKAIAARIAQYRRAYDLPGDKNRDQAEKIDAVSARHDISILLRAISARYEAGFGPIECAAQFMAFLTLVVAPLGLLLLFQLAFLPFQHEGLTNFHRGVVLFDIAICLWTVSFLAPRLKRHRLAVQVPIWVICASAGVIAGLAAFPGELVYENCPPFLHWVTIQFFERQDPVDYVRKGSKLAFSNRLIIPDDPHLASPASPVQPTTKKLDSERVIQDEIAGIFSDNVSISARGRNFRRAIFDRSILARVDFSASDLTEARFQDANLENAVFECGKYITLSKQARRSKNLADEMETVGIVSEKQGENCTILFGAKFYRASLQGTSFISAILNEADLSNSFLSNTDFRYALMNGAVMKRVRGRGVNFSYAELMGANFHGAQIRAADFSNTISVAADFSFAQLPAADFGASSLQGSNFSAASLLLANFASSLVLGADFSQGMLQGSSFAYAYLYDSTLTGANLSLVNSERTITKNLMADCIDPYLPGTGQERSEKCKPVYENEYSADYSYPMKDIGRRFNPPTDDFGFDVGSYAGDYFYDAGIAPLKTVNQSSLEELSKELTANVDNYTKERISQAIESLKNRAPDKKFNKLEPASDMEREAHDTAVVNRLEFIACVGEGAPYVAKALLDSGRLSRSKLSDKSRGESKLLFNERRDKVVTHLKQARSGNDLTCPGAIGLTEADFKQALSRN